MMVLPSASFAEIAVALFEDARYCAENNERMEVLAERLTIAGITESTRDRILAEATRRADLSAAAHAWFRAMCGHEAAIRDLIESHVGKINVRAAA